MVFSAYWAGLDGWQKGFGAAVAVREALYVLATLVGLAYNPAFLLVDVGATVRDKEWMSSAGHLRGGGYVFLGMYVLAPEKFVAFATLGAGSSNGEISPFDFFLRILLLLGGVLLDLCGVAALVAGLLSPAGLAPALAVGYGATALGGLFMIGFFVTVL